MDHALAPTLLTVSLVSGSIRPWRLGSVGEMLLLTACVACGALGVVGMFLA